jgi:phage baseplate assembly protein V
MSLADRLRGMVSRCVVNLVADSFKLQALQVTLFADQTPDEVEHFQHYGFTSVPHAGAEGIALAVGGSTGHTVVINVDDRRYRLASLANGEVALYDDLGQKVHLTRSGMVVHGGGLPVLVTDTPQVTLDTPLTICTGQLVVQGLLSYQAGLQGSGGGASIAGPLAVAGGSVTHNGTSIGGAHTHGGVQAGPDQTGVPG